MTTKEMIQEICGSVENTHLFLYTSEQLFEMHNGIWRPVEDHAVEHYMDEAARQLFGNEKYHDFLQAAMHRGIKGDFIDHLKSVYFVPRDIANAREDPYKVGFLNGYVDMNEFKKDGFITLHSYGEAQAQNHYFFQQVPHCLNEDLLAKYHDRVPGGDEILYNEAPRIYGFFLAQMGFERLNTQIAKIGYCFYRSNPYKLMFMELGDRDTGKTTYARLLMKVVGDGNVARESIQDLANYPFSAANLHYKLLNIYDDLPNKALHSTGMLKMLSGESPIGAQRKFKSSLSFDNYAKLVFTTNRLPPLKDLDDEAFFSRWIITEYDQQFERNDTFARALLGDEKEIQGLIVAALYALKGLLDVGYEFMRGTTNYTDLWKRQINSIYAFIKEGQEAGTLLLDPTLIIGKEELYGLYTQFIEDEEIDSAETKTLFTQELERLFGVTITREQREGSRIKVYKGIGTPNGTRQPQAALGKST
jgi:putative DNA primase/helicase